MLSFFFVSPQSRAYYELIPWTLKKKTNNENGEKDKEIKNSLTADTGC
jgi:hypothetical protein